VFLKVHEKFLGQRTIFDQTFVIEQLISSREGDMVLLRRSKTEKLNLWYWPKSESLTPARLRLSLLIAAMGLSAN